MGDDSLLKLLLSGVESFGTLGILVFFIWAFFGGHIISRKTLDEIIDGYAQKTDERIERMISRIVEEIRSEMRKRSF